MSAAGTCAAAMATAIARSEGPLCAIGAVTHGPGGASQIGRDHLANKFDLVGVEHASYVRIRCPRTNAGWLHTRRRCGGGRRRARACVASVFVSAKGQDTVDARRRVEAPTPRTCGPTETCEANTLSDDPVRTKDECAIVRPVASTDSTCPRPPPPHPHPPAVLHPLSPPSPPSNRSAHIHSAPRPYAATPRLSLPNLSFR